MDRQSSKAQKGEIEFRRKLVDQQVAGQKLFDDEFDGPGILKILADRMKKTLEQISRLKDGNVTVSPYLEIGAERCQRALVMENDLNASGAAADISFDMLKSCAHYMSVFRKSKAPLRICCDANNLPFLTGTIPFVFCYQTLHHFPDPAPVVGEIFRVLSPGGHFALNEEPFRKILHVNLYKGRKIYAKDAPPPGKLVDILNFFFSETNSNEASHGVIENDRISLSTWRHALSCFEDKRIFLRTIKGVQAALFAPPSKWRYLFAWLFGGEIYGLCRKAGTLPPSFCLTVRDSLSCQVCAEKGKESVLLLDDTAASCGVCGSRYPLEDGVLFLFPRDKFMELYPEIFRKAEING